MRTYRASVVGAGMGGQLSISALGASERYDLVAVADISPAAREALTATRPGLRAFDSHEAMFAECPTDVVCVSTWPPSHLPITQAALALPLKGILVEKPLADKTADGERLLSAIRGQGLPMVVPHGLLVAAHSTEVLRRVRAGDIGRLSLVEIECTGWDIINAGIHWLSFFLWLVDREPVQYVMAVCDASTRTYRDGMQVETTAVTYAETSSGVRVVMTTGDYVRIGREGKGVLFRLVGDEGVIEFWGWESAYAIRSRSHPAGELVQVPPHAKSFHQLYLDALAEQMDKGAPDYAIPESSLAALELCEAAYLSSKHRCQVKLPLAGFTPPAPSNWEPGKPYAGRGGGRDGRKLP